ncbi:hypothetical protein TPHA_0F01530 [Tetrapisispora phaffii CBS 4417]|uniref:Dystroglycan-type cadherin-like domain-containing protein n=1 Tax=Tetrapisispora phaffii (strain ATCC 24235 / CBS 4417 / NBRC 1672 / NRRL Y-8282 / UCD 70-5) TaxID=1071381 RepID=G8BV55_TETPH|nr:hypothetical protein TPHA_0F01530 [Tetrapisispora phaffii CBS 4417]CCE63637.1 hypothetical protein TPHA_0F01530 [Tetrapisispora phaffii CBS 4417]
MIRTLSTVLAYLLFLIANVNSYPYEAYPINKQIPPVARVNEDFQFMISNDTYKSSLNDYQQITYKAFNLPTWLSFDESTRTLTGSPSSDIFTDLTAELLYFNFILEGTDSSDNKKLNNTYQLVITNYTSVEVAESFNLLALLKNYGDTDGKNGLILSPNDVFNITFERSDFDSSSGYSVSTYYGRSEKYHAPLPNWIFFDSNNLKFSGTAPVANSQIAPQVSYDFSFIASDIEGYAGSEIPFSIVVGAHSLTTTVQNTILINVTDDGAFNYELPLDYTFLDQQLVSTENISSVQLIDAPDWVSLNNYTIEGTVNSDSANYGNNTFSVSLYDIYGDAIYFNFEILSTTSLFAITSFPSVNATRGSYFQYAFLPSQFTDYDNTEVTIKPSNSSQDYSWLSFSSSNLTILGNVPELFESLDLSVIATKGEETESLIFSIMGVGNSSTTFNSTNSTSMSSRSSSSTRTSLSSSTTSTSSSSSTSASSSQSQSTTASSTASTVAVSKTSSNKKTVAIACGVVIPICFIILLVLVFLFWRRKTNKAAADEEEHPTTDGPAIKPYSPNNGESSPSDPFVDDNNQRSITGLVYNSSSSDSSSFSDKDTRSSSESSNDIYVDANHNPSREMLLGSMDNYSSENLNDNNRTSSLYLNDEPALRKSWRYTQNTLSNITEGKGRESILSLNTISTDEFINTKISNEGQVNKDPRKSTLGLRDSVFGSKSSVYFNRNSASNQESSEIALPTLQENRKSLNPFINQTESDSKLSPSLVSSSSDEIIPIRQGNSYGWVNKNDSLNSKLGKKKVVTINDDSNIDIGEGLEYEGHLAEQV